MADQILLSSDLPDILEYERAENEKLLSQSSGLSYKKLKNASASPENVLSGKTFYSGDKNLKTGSMENRGQWSSVYSGNNVTIPSGYHNGSGYITVSGGNQGSWGTRIAAGSSVTIPQGWHNGSGTVTADMGREETVIIFTGSNSTTPINEIVIYQNGSMACERALSSSGYNNSMVRLTWDGTAYVWTWHMYVNKRSWVYRNNSMVGTYEAGAEFASIVWNSDYVAYRVFPI